MMTKSQYIKEYNVPDILAMIRNNRRQPKVCSDRSEGRLVMISGATSGIGYYTARKYASMGADLLCITRNEEKTLALKEELESEFGVKCDYRIADLGNMPEVHALGKELCALERSIDVIIQNAGVFLTRQELTDEGIDKVFVLQHLSSFILNMHLAKKLMAQEQARIILVNSEGHRFAPWGLKLDDLNWERRRYSGLKSYGSAKLAQLLTMLIFKERFEGTGVTINAMHPGAVKSETGQENGRFYRWYKKNVLDRMLRSTDISSESLYYLGTSPEIEKESSLFYNLTTVETPAPPALDMEAAWEIWEKSLELAGMEGVTNKVIQGCMEAAGQAGTRTVERSTGSAADPKKQNETDSGG